MFAKHPKIAKRWAKKTKGKLPESVNDKIRKAMR
jgi:hypothetical protein